MDLTATIGESHTKDKKDIKQQGIAAICDKIINTCYHMTSDRYVEQMMAWSMAIAMIRTRASQPFSR